MISFSFFLVPTISAGHCGLMGWWFFTKNQVFSTIHKNPRLITLIFATLLCSWSQNQAFIVHPWGQHLHSRKGQQRSACVQLCVGGSFHFHGWTEPTCLWSDALHMYDVNGLPLSLHTDAVFMVLLRCQVNSLTKTPDSSIFFFMRNNYSLCIYDARLGFLPYKLPLVLVSIMRF